ncbi:MAG TPA: MFS transporter [Actinomycetota bacterium]|nr:MFS transporter [Actinomycetota bacterium]
MIRSPDEHRRLARRNTVLLASAQGLVQVASPVMLLIGVVEIAELSGHESSTGFLNAAYFLAAAAGAFLVGRSMDRFGRRPGLLASYTLLILAGIGGAASVAAGSWIGLLLCAVPFGAAFGGANLARGAVADMYPAERRGRAVGYVLAAGTVGAVASPFLVAFLQEFAEHRLDANPNVLPWILVPAGALGAIACVIRVRPDPRDMAVDEPIEAVGRRPRELLGAPSIRMAVVAAAVGQMAMVAVMGVTPVALHQHDVSPTAVSSVISVHIAGMFAFSPLIGAALDRFGRRPGLIVGAALSIGGALLAATEGAALLVGAGLFAIGLGWSATFLGATAVISDATDPAERAGALGVMDLTVSLSSAAAGLASGFVFEGAGFRVLGLATAALVLLVVVSALRIHGSSVARATADER